MMKKFIRHDLGPTGLRLEKWVTKPKGRGICVDNARCFKIFEMLKNGGVLSN